MLHTLRSRIAALVTVLVIGSLGIGVGAAIGIQSLHRDLGAAGRGYRQLRQVFEVGYHVAAARDALHNHQPGSALASAQLAAVRLQSTGTDAVLEESQAKTCRALLHQLIGELRRDDPSAEATLNRALGELAGMSAQIRQSVAMQEDAAERHRRATFLHVCIASGLVLIGGVVVGVSLYRSVVRPLDRLAAGVRRFASGRLQEQLETSGDREFAALADDFNAMARQLQGLYDNLEQRVQLKSRQLVQSERLASVGYLAAGVAHEINNPLGIIAGYGERSLAILRRGQGGPVSVDAAKSIDRSIGIICDEAFRCKQITDRLLMLARPGEQARAIVSVARIANDVVTSVGGLSRFTDRRIVLAADEQQPLAVFANEGELRQVVLNLVINALEAVDPARGEVYVSVTRDAGEIELSVRDNGRGISPDVLPHVFEPFFTQKRGERAAGEHPGTGLGLSVAHAIVQDCLGRIEAHSDGAGAGSRFIVRLPAAKEGSNVHPV